MPSLHHHWDWLFILWNHSLQVTYQKNKMVSNSTKISVQSMIWKWTIMDLWNSNKKSRDRRFKFVLPTSCMWNYNCCNVIEQWQQLGKLSFEPVMICLVKGIEYNSYCNLHSADGKLNCVWRSTWNATVFKCWFFVAHGKSVLIIFEDHQTGDNESEYICIHTCVSL